MRNQIDIPSFSPAFIEQVIYPLLAVEGEIANHKLDKGSLTKWGVASAYHPDVLRPDYDVLDAVLFYRDMVLNGGGLVLRQAGFEYSTLLMYMQIEVHIGSRRAVRLLQCALQGSFVNRALRVDGVLGPKTREAISFYKEGKGNRADDNLIRALSSAQRAFYDYHAQATNQSHFRAGWMNRVDWFEYPDLIQDEQIALVDTAVAEAKQRRAQETERHADPSFPGLGGPIQTA